MTELLNNVKLRLPALVLLAASFLLWPNYDPCRPAGPVLLSNPTLADAAQVVGDCSEADSVFTLRRMAGGDAPSIVFQFPDLSGARLLRVRGRMRAENVVPGAHGYLAARVILLQVDAAGNKAGVFDGNLYGQGSFGWTPFLNDFFIRRGFDRAELRLSQDGLSGMAQFDSIEVIPVELRPATPWIKGGFAVLWLALGLLYYGRCRLNTRKLRHLILLNVIVILFGVLLPGHVMQSGLSRLHWFLSEAAHSGETFIAAGIRIGLPQHFVGIVGQSFGHFALFASLCFLVLLSGALEGQRGCYYIMVAGDLLLFGAVTEALQFLTPGRTVDLVDLLCNAYGVLTAMVLFFGVNILWRNPGPWMAGKKN